MVGFVCLHWLIHCRDRALRHFGYFQRAIRGRVCLGYAPITYHEPCDLAASVAGDHPAADFAVLELDQKLVSCVGCWLSRPARHFGWDDDEQHRSRVGMYAADDDDLSCGLIADFIGYERLQQIHEIDLCATTCWTSNRRPVAKLAQ